MADTFMRVSVKGDKGAFLFLKKVVAKTPKEGRKLTERLADTIMNKAKQLVAPLGTGTGNLKGSIRKDEMSRGFSVTAGDGTTVNRLGMNYAVFQEKGFAPHRTQLWNFNRGSRLYQELKAGGVRDFDSIGVSRHTPFMDPAFRFALKRLKPELERTAKNIIRG